MIKKIQFFVMKLLLLLLALNANAIEVNVEFSADAIQIAPDRMQLKSKIFVSKAAVRTEMVRQGQRVVDITYPKEGRRVLLYPDRKVYREVTGLSVTSSWSGSTAKNPCEGVRESVCKKIGTEVLQGVTVDKWQVEHRYKGKLVKSLHWIDYKRNLSIKEMLADGSVNELIMKGSGSLNKRNVEQWEFVNSHPSGYRSVSKQWYDPQLKMVIREQMQGGYLRELYNISVAQQDKKLFQIPKDFRKIKEKLI